MSEQNTKTATKSFLNSIYKNVKMGGDAIIDLMPKVSDEKLREFKISVLPEHGTVIFDDDGSFYYFPEKGYEGEVRFTFVYNEYLSWSEDCVVTVTVQ